MNLIDKFAFWLFFRRRDKIGKYSASVAPERTMLLGMAMVEAVMTVNPDAGIAVIKGRSEAWGVMSTPGHIHTAECSGEAIH